jgi:hypothetical protein
VCQTCFQVLRMHIAVDKTKTLSSEVYFLENVLLVSVVVGRSNEICKPLKCE